MNNAPADYATPRPSVENTGSKMDVDSAAVAAGKFTLDSAASANSYEREKRRTRRVERE